MAVLAVTTGGAAVGPQGRFDVPMPGFSPPTTVLHVGSPESAGLDPAPIAEAKTTIANSPLFPGAVSLLAHDGVTVDLTATGKAVRYADATAELPSDQQVPMRPDTIFDVASVSKLFTSIAVLGLVEDGKVAVDERVASYLPEFGVNGKETITVKQLLTHTSGLEPFIPLWSDWPDKPARIKAVMDRAPAAPPGSVYTYSDLNLITLGVLVERLSGEPLDVVVAKRITTPLGLTDTGYNPSADKRGRIAATEFQTAPVRGMVRGEVHDENAWSLGGVAGHAGIFSTAKDLAVLGQTILNGGIYRGKRILREATVREMLTNHNAAYPGNAHGLGFELDQRWYMGGLSGPRTAGHTGYTGTSLVLDPASRSIAIRLTNRVHPVRTNGSINSARETLATALARALAVRPRQGPTAWYTATGGATLLTPPLAARGEVTVRFDVFVDTDPNDGLLLEAGSGETWRAVPVRASGPGAPAGEVAALSGSGHRSWWTVNAIAPVGAHVTFRWRYVTDSRYTGRGVTIDRILVTQSGRNLLNGEKQPHLIRPLGWAAKTR
ncbi:serine hydrolase domain-containing protein [Actinokineospora diospyrosa]|uniref:CubicO group peptidase, beta-lactamase class C family n=1 Tax=Actinokineospora diospyrosa TaxID=103728 RepID=A0ABT1IEF7_9PSEU|nr:serine hydrolase domain-containing protein [Actinokineospora diospyrosa]MCP2270706.1 CubicO group peptidase, beta-lactamase class C family [Actinokineospora diospyrosa]